MKDSDSTIPLHFLPSGPEVPIEEATLLEALRVPHPRRSVPGAGVLHAPGKKERRKRERQARKAARKRDRR